MKYSGTIIWYNAERGFGFISSDKNDLPVFADETELPSSSKAMSVGSRVSFRLQELSKGFKASNIQILKT